MLVRWVYTQLREHGHVHRPVIGAGLQTITPSLAAALKLPRESGVIVSDLLPGTPAADAGMRLNDIIVRVNDRPMDNIAAWIGLSFQHVPGSAMKVNVLRGTQCSPSASPCRHRRAQRSARRSEGPASAPDPIARHPGDRARQAHGRGDRTGPPGIRSRRDCADSNPRGSDIGLQPGDLIHRDQRQERVFCKTISGRSSLRLKCAGDRSRCWSKGRAAGRSLLVRHAVTDQTL